MNRLVLPQPKRRPLPATAAAQGQVPPGQRVEVARGELTGMRGIVVRAIEPGRWLIRLEGTVAGIMVSMPRSGLRLVASHDRH